jgi:hypothetical protein
MVAIMQAAGRQLAARQKKKKKTGDVRS